MKLKTEIFYNQLLTEKGKIYLSKLQQKSIYHSCIISPDLSMFYNVVKNTDLNFYLDYNLKYRKHKALFLENICLNYGKLDLEKIVEIENQLENMCFSSVEISNLYL